MDTSVATSGDQDTLTITATPRNDKVLFRNGYIASINLTEATREIIYYNDVIGIVTVNGGKGDDELIFDDVISRQMMVNGDAGNDRFIVGQLYNDSSDSQPPVDTVVMVVDYHIMMHQLC